ncbi:MAG: HAMP domain-containing sensor histidine kinase [Nitriliruptorales bacterium]|nr:HAMP domain-containing sensor histidine kinase [Nitriliruptorales bacterium]
MAKGGDGRPGVDEPVHRRVDAAVGLYVLAAIIWIVATGWLAPLVAERSGLSVTVIEVTKGIGFVVVTALVLRSVLHRGAARISQLSIEQRASLAELRRAEEVRARFLRGVSHELRTPLMNVKGYSETMRAHLDRLDNEDLRAMLERLTVNSRRLERLIIDVLELELSPEDHLLDTSAISLDEHVRRTVRQLEPHDHQVEVDAEPVRITVDPKRLERVVEELVENAIFHTPQGTLVQVRVWTDERFVRLEVEDTGPGIVPEVAEELFEPFQQGPGVDSSPSPGVGLGLTVARRYARAHGGDITYRTGAGGRGACFVGWMQHMSDARTTDANSVQEGLQPIHQDSTG